MARIAKDYESRRSEIMDAGWDLFSQQGYDATTVNDVLHKVSISKGTFYHYFDSKTKLLDEVIERMAREGVDVFNAVVRDESASAINKFNKLLSVGAEWKAERMKVIIELGRLMLRDENIVLRHKLNERTAELITPAWASLIEQGVREKVFTARNAREAAELIVLTSNAIREMNLSDILKLKEHPEYLERINRRLTLLIESIEKILGAPEGSIKRFDMSFLKAIVEKGLD